MRQSRASERPRPERADAGSWDGPILGLRSGLQELLFFTNSCGVLGKFDDVTEHFGIRPLGNMAVRVAALPPTESNERVPPRIDVNFYPLNSLPLRCDSSFVQALERSAVVEDERTTGESDGNEVTTTARPPRDPSHVSAPSSGPNREPSFVSPFEAHLA